MRVADHIGVLYQSHLVRFAAKDDMRADDDPIINQFLRGRAYGPIGMDEMATEETDVERELVQRAQEREERDGEFLPV
jgi:phospholipid/cholesterol/gamma-HCH transport system ATP-binding protein